MQIDDFIFTFCVFYFFSSLLFVFFFRLKNNFNVTNSKIRDRFRFMFVREPYRKLWSAYVDKFLLPDFWHNTFTKMYVLRRYILPHMHVPVKRIVQALSISKVCTDSI